jgi:hypothetical protein
MLSRTSAVLMISISVVLCGSARGAITAFWQQVTITPVAITSDPTLASMQCWDLMVTTSGNWAAAAMGATLPASLTFYKHPLGGLTRPDPGLFGASPALEFTTYVSSPSDNGTNHTTTVFGGHPQSFPPSLGDATSPFPGRFSMVWGELIPDPPGTFQIARLTFPLAAIPDVVDNPDPSRTSQVSPDSTAFIPEIPEPSAVAFMAAGGLLTICNSRMRTALNRERRRRCSNCET